MSRWKSVMMVLLVTLIAGPGAAALAQRPYRMNDRQVEQIIRSVERSANNFRASLDAALDRSRLDGTSREDNINQFVRDFEDATDNLRARFNDRRSVAGDVETVLDRAARIDNFMSRQRLTTRAQNDWSVLKGDLNRLAGAYGVSWRWDRPGGGFPDTSATPSRLNDREVAAILTRVENRSRNFRASVDAALDRSRADGTRFEDDINNYMREFTDATDRLRERFDGRRSVAADVETVLDRAARIDDFMQRNRLTQRAERDWSLLRTDLDDLARAYNVTPRWNSSSYSSIRPSTGGFRQQLTGTYRLDTTRSENPRAVAERATRNLPFSERQRVTDQLLQRLESPEALAIEQRGRTVTIASSRRAQTTFEADGSERVERLPDGRTVRVRAALIGDQLTVSSAGDRASDFTVTFEPEENGRRLRITRRINTDRLDQTVLIESYYDKTAETAQWNVYDGDGSSFPSSAGTAGSGDFVIPNGTTLVAVLDNNLSTKEAREGDRFTMTVRDPGQYEGARIEGYVSQLDRSGRVSGRSQMTLNFERISLRDGRSYRFAGFVESLRATNGETIKVDNEGAVREGGSQTEKTVQRAAIGTAVGAIIGAIAGGGKGAAIGAAIGAGAGAGSVYVQGRDDLELLSGTEVTIRASAPR